MRKGPLLAAFGGKNNIQVAERGRGGTCPAVPTAKGT